jgi:hypothetical protein
VDTVAQLTILVAACTTSPAGRVTDARHGGWSDATAEHYSGVGRNRDP